MWQDPVADDDEPTPSNRLRTRRLVGWGVGVSVLIAGAAGAVVWMAPPTGPATGVVATIPMEGNPVHALATPDDRVYVANKGAGTVSVIEGTRVVATDGTIYVPNMGDGTVSVIQGTRVVATVPVGERPRGALVLANGLVYVADIDGAGVAVVDGTEVVAAIHVGGNPLALAASRDGMGYVTNLNGTVSVIEGTLLLATVPVAQGAGFAQVTTDGHVYIAASEDDSVWILR